MTMDRQACSLRHYETVGEGYEILATPRVSTRAHSLEVAHERWFNRAVTSLFPFCDICIVKKKKGKKKKREGKTQLQAIPKFAVGVCNRNQAMQWRSPEELQRSSSPECQDIDGRSASILIFDQSKK